MLTQHGLMRMPSLVPALVLGVIIVAITGSIAIVSNSPELWLIPLGIMALIAILMKTEIGLYALLIVIYLNGLASVYELFPRQTVTLLIDIIILVIVLKALVVLLAERRQPVRTPIDIPLGLFLLLLMVSSIANALPVDSLLFGLRFYLKYIFLFYAIVNLGVSERFFKHAIFLLVSLILLQVPVTFIQFLQYGFADIVSGTLGFKASPVMLFICTGGAALLLGFYLYYKQLWLLPMGGGVLFIPPLLGTAVASLFLYPAALLFAGRRALSRYRRAVVAGFLIMVALVLSLSFVQSEGGNYLDGAFAFLRASLDNESNLGYTSWNTATGQAPGRLLSLAIAYGYVQRDMSHFVLGFGPGSASYSGGAGFQGRLYDPNSPWRNSLSVGIVEWGLMGVLLFCLVLIALWRMNRVNSGFVSTPFWQAVSFGFEGFWIVYLITSFYYINWAENVSSFTIWLLAAAIFSHVQSSTVHKRDTGKSGMKVPV